METIIGHDQYACAIKLYEYASVIGYSECQFFGVNNPADPMYSCQDIWSKNERDNALMYLQDAQEQIEKVLGYPLSPKWISGEIHPAKSPITVNWSKLIDCGIMKTDTIGSNVGLDPSADPGTAAVATTLTSIDGIHIYYPGTDIEIFPSKLNIVGGTLNIEIPNCRAVDYLLLDNPSGGLDYTDHSNFETLIDVKHIYTDPSTQAYLLGTCTCGVGCGCAKCADSVGDACERIKDPDIGTMFLSKATYSAATGLWTSSCACCACAYYDRVMVNYHAGLNTLPRKLKNCIIRLAHTLMPNEPCGCSVAKRLWSRDMNIPSILTAERLNCQFGVADGAWAAWIGIQNEIVHRLGVM